MTWGQILLKVFKYKCKYFLMYLNTNTLFFNVFKYKYIWKVFKYKYFVNITLCHTHISTPISTYTVLSCLICTKYLYLYLNTFQMYLYLNTLKNKVFVFKYFKKYLHMYLN